MKKIIAVGLTLALLLGGCGNQGDGQVAEGEIRIVTSFYPMYLLTQEVVAGIDGITVENMAQPETGCLHDYQLTMEDRKVLEHGGVLILNGGGMESFLPDVEEMGSMVLLDASEGIEGLAMEGHEHDHEEEVDDHEGHSHGDVNAHFWLSPKRATQQVENIAEKLGEAYPQHADVFLANGERFAKQVHGLEERVEAIDADHAHIAIFHEGFYYFTELFDFHAVIALFPEEHAVPSARDLVAATETAKAEDVWLFFAAEDAGLKYAKLLAEEVHGQVILLDPLTGEGTGGYLSRMEANINVIESGIRER